MKEKTIYAGIFLFAIICMVLFYVSKPKPIKIKTIIPTKIVTEKDKLIAVIKKYETFLPNRDLQNGKYYVGYGHRCYFDEFTETIDTNMANQILEEDLQSYIDKLDSWNLSDRKKLAVASFCFNFGWGYFLNSDLYRLIKDNKPVAVEWLKHRCYKGNVNEGLAERRAYEVYLYSF